MLNLDTSVARMMSFEVSREIRTLNMLATVWGFQLILAIIFPGDSIYNAFALDSSTVKWNDN